MHNLDLFSLNSTLDYFAGLPKTQS